MNPEHLELLVTRVMPYGKYKGRLIADLLRMDPSDEAFQAKMQTLRENVEQHVEEEEGELFPKVERLVDDRDLEGLGAAREETQKRLTGAGNPRDAIPGETSAPAPV